MLVTPPSCRLRGSPDMFSQGREYPACGGKFFLLVIKADKTFSYKKIDLFLKGVHMTTSCCTVG